MRSITNAILPFYHASICNNSWLIYTHSPFYHRYHITVLFVVIVYFAIWNECGFSSCHTSLMLMLFNVLLHIHTIQSPQSIHIQSCHSAKGSDWLRSNYLFYVLSLLNHLFSHLIAKLDDNGASDGSGDRSQLHFITQTWWLLSISLYWFAIDASLRFSSFQFNFEM